MVAPERFLLSVDVDVLLQILRQCESFEAEDADVLLDRLVGCDVSSQRETRRVSLAAACQFAFVRSFHRLSLFRVNVILITSLYGDYTIKISFNVTINNYEKFAKFYRKMHPKLSRLFIAENIKNGRNKTENESGIVHNQEVANNSIFIGLKKVTFQR